MAVGATGTRLAGGPAGRVTTGDGGGVVVAVTAGGGAVVLVVVAAWDAISLRTGAEPGEDTS